MHAYKAYAGYVIWHVGDHWQVECTEPTDTQPAILSENNVPLWPRESPIRLRHVDTETYLSASDAYIYGQPIRGQMEVTTVDSADSEETQWVAEVGSICMHW